MPKTVENFRSLHWIGILTVAMGLNGCSLGYLLRQGAAQASLLLKQEPLDRAIDRLPAEKAEKLRFVREIKRYAETTIGLEQTQSYEAYVELDDQALSHVVSAAFRDRLEPYLWQFPLVGAVPYKGFFEKADAQREQAKLERDGLDTHVRGVAAFSLLGYLADPLYSSMLQYSREGLANLVIHELTHATVFLPGNPTFNEGFASYVGNTGSVEFLEARFGAGSPEARSARDQAHDDQLFSTFVQRLLATLRQHYARPDLSPAEKIAGREAVFERARSEYAALPFRRANHRDFGKPSLNNAYILLFDTYQRDLSRFERIRGRFPTLRAMVAFFRDEVARQKDPEAFLAVWETGSPAPTP